MSKCAVICNSVKCGVTMIVMGDNNCCQFTQLHDYIIEVQDCAELNGTINANAIARPTHYYTVLHTTAHGTSLAYITVLHTTALA